MATAETLLIQTRDIRRRSGFMISGLPFGHTIFHV
jgi:hypothetical protein